MSTCSMARMPTLIISGVGGPANANRGGRRSRCTKYGWPVGPTLNYLRRGGPANANRGGRRSRFTKYGWPVGPKLKYLRRGGTGQCQSRRPAEPVYEIRLAGGPDAELSPAWGDRPMPIEEAGGAGVRNTA